MRGQVATNPNQHEPLLASWAKSQAGPCIGLYSLRCFWTDTIHTHARIRRQRPRQALGRNPDRLTLVERTALAGKMIALEVYTPDTFPFRRIEAIGDSIDACVRMLQERGLDPRRFEYSPLGPAY